MVSSVQGRGQHPKTLIEALDYFAKYENCHNFLVAIRWPDGVRCPHCGFPVVRYMGSVRRWQYYEKHERPQFSLKTGTIFRGVAHHATEVAGGRLDDRQLQERDQLLRGSPGDRGDQKTAWFMGHRIRTAIHVGSFDRLLGEDGDDLRG